MQTQSEQIGKVAEALSKAQSTMLEAKEDAKNPFFKSNYADLTSVWRACKKSLTDNGLAVTQPTVCIDGQLYLATKIIHSGSGEWLQGFYPIYLPKQDPQAVGSAITYARRYSLASMVGVHKEGEDDDAEEAMRKEVINETQLKDLIKSIGSDEEAKDIILKRFSVKAFNEIPKDRYGTMMVWLENRKKETSNGKASVA